MYWSLKESCAFFILNEKSSYQVTLSRVTRSFIFYFHHRVKKCFCCKFRWMDGRVVEGTGFENQHTYVSGVRIPLHPSEDSMKNCKPSRILERLTVLQTFIVNRFFIGFYFFRLELFWLLFSFHSLLVFIIVYSSKKCIAIFWILSHASNIWVFYQTCFVKTIFHAQRHEDRQLHEDTKWKIKKYKKTKTK